MMSEQERNELEAENDGYANDLQRAHAAARLTTPIRNDRPKVAGLLKRGFTVYLLCTPVYCRSTDGILGESCKIVGCSEDAEQAGKEAMNCVSESDMEFGDCRLEVHRPASALGTTLYCPASREELDQEVPF